MADKSGHITLETRFGGDLRLAPPSRDYGRVRDPEQGERKRKIDEIMERRELERAGAEVWDEM